MSNFIIDLMSFGKNENKNKKLALSSSCMLTASTMKTGGTMKQNSKFDLELC